jgi:D-3-phosphoglycerate dehydrogenase
LAEKAMRCLIADDLHPVFLEGMAGSGLDWQYLPQLSQSEFLRELADAHILVIRSRFLINAEVIRAAPNLRIIARAGAGLDGIDVEFAESRGIKVLHAAEGNAAAVAEHAIGMMLGLLARIPEADRAIRSGLWDREGFRGKELGHRCVGLIGYGNMGPAVARRLQGFGCRVIAYDKYRLDWPDSFAERVDEDVLQKESDIISIHVPLTSDTRGMVNQDYLSKCRPGLILINTSRGQVLNPSGMLDFLDSGQLAGIGLDVFHEEPLFKKNISYSKEILKLIIRPEVLSTPHVAGWTTESYEKISGVLLQKILSLTKTVEVENTP